jgi:ABC-type Mn2+/Zn2+ transport system permease subunit
MRYWRWWVVAFVCLTLLCCLSSCVFTRLTEDMEAMRQDAFRSHEMAEAYLVGLFIGASIENWLMGMLVVLGLTLVLVAFTVLLERKQRYES